MANQIDPSGVVGEVKRQHFIEAGIVAGTAALLAAWQPAFGAQSRDTPVGALTVHQTFGAHRYAEQPGFGWEACRVGAAADIVLTPDVLRQEILGFGASFTDSACYIFDRLAPEARRELFAELFHPSRMALNVGRTCIGSSDYSTKIYSYDDSSAPDPDLRRFSIELDRRWIVPMLREARAVNPDIFLLASPWSPPAWMKDNNSALGGTMRWRYLPAYANYLTRFVQAYSAEGLAIDALTSQNEVDTDQDGRMPQCTWPQEMEVEFVGNILGPALERAGVSTKIWIIDHNYNLWGRAIASLEDAGVQRHADGVAWHGYSGKPSAMSRVHDAFPAKHAYWTEGGPNYTSPVYATDWARWAAQFTDILRNWARCIIAWNFALDERGKPNLGPFSCGGLITIDSATRDIVRSGMYWAMAHFSRSVRRGARVVESRGALEDLAHVAFENPGGGGVLVLTNRGARILVPRIVRGNRRTSVTLPPNSVTTLTWPPVARGAAPPVPFGVV
ncbi:MAG: glucosylceramidase [Candidatus Eremiobacteraeota bacterium]|jgi:glucosylceramidase|nr:glucosylceramidase [Candidatus Eremiobacteraeota bacterium]